jgi:hypothetical protein
MIWANLDMITRRSLLEKGLPLHYYLEHLLHSSSAVRELSKDTLQIVNTVELPVNSYFAATLPDDFVDDVGVFVPAGQLLQPVPKKNSISPLRAMNSSGTFVPYTDLLNLNEQTFFGYPSGWTFWWNINDWGEPTGRWFGAGGGAKANGYQIFRERRQIQFTETFTSDTAVLMYISDGQRADNATQIDARAIKCIQSYADWKSSPHAAMKDSPEAATFYNEKRLLRAQFDDLTVVDIKQIFYKAYMAAAKT